MDTVSTSEEWGIPQSTLHDKYNLFVNSVETFELDSIRHVTADIQRWSQHWDYTIGDSLFDTGDETDQQPKEMWSPLWLLD